MFRTLVFLLLLCGAAHADPIIGRASVVDGDTIEITGHRIRINGVDAPESRQTCRDSGGREYRCGQQAALSLAAWLDGAQPVRCNPVDRDRYGRIVAICQRGGADVGEWLVRHGHALDWPRYSGGRYAAAQQAASRARVGMWVGDFAPPWDWRKRSR